MLTLLANIVNNMCVLVVLSHLTTTHGYGTMYMCYIGHTKHTLCHYMGHITQNHNWYQTTTTHGGIYENNT